MNKRFLTLIYFLILLVSNPLFSQVRKALTDADKNSLEGIIVEKYYTYDPNDKMDTTGGCLPKGAVTYRIYVDLKPNYTLQAIYGVTDHPLSIKTTTYFFNNTESGQGTGDFINAKKTTNTTGAFDSWLTIGAATSTYLGIPKADDKDGTVDGFIAGTVKPITYFGITPAFFTLHNTAGTFATSNGSWAIFGGIKGATDDNKILIAQLTTDGKLSYELNLQIGTPTGGTINFVAVNPQDTEIKYDALINTNIPK